MKKIQLGQEHIRHGDIMTITQSCQEHRGYEDVMTITHSGH